MTTRSGLRLTGRAAAKKLLDDRRRFLDLQNHLARAVRLIHADPTPPGVRLLIGRDPLG